jgi:hypothetical protein
MTLTFCGRHWWCAICRRHLITDDVLSARELFFFISPVPESFRSRWSSRNTSSSALEKCLEIRARNRGSIVWLCWIFTGIRHDILRESFLRSERWDELDVIIQHNNLATMREKALPTIKCQRVIDSTKGGWREREILGRMCARRFKRNNTTRVRNAEWAGRKGRRGDMEFLHFSS